jgi:hypothetical protein
MRIIWNSIQWQTTWGMTLKYNELQDLVLPKVSIDEFAPKTGNNDEVIVLGFYVKDKEPAKDLSHFLETGHTIF